ncbi:MULTISPECIES: ABC transporter permease [Mycobacteriaceae]|uniref:ABC transporter permease n=1 Tax=Mycobacteriaceae TaxID=1762 RepID=UPI0007FF35A6|nr:MULTISPECIES: ABC transporter permease [Mycobacteriaceae]MCK0175635.1 ABC transporter permease [Mycolicibacterium sp. F2034L]OBB58671.1 ABC transporter permease [Mycobacterium sp. 852013-51886_SCH5428379]
MSALEVLDSERIKLTTTRSPLWSAAAVVVLSLGVTAMLVAASSAYDRMTPEEAILGVAVFGVPVLMILSSLAVTGEYRSGLIRSTFLAVPRRPLVLIAKAVVTSVFSGLCAAATSFIAVIIAGLPPGEGSTWRAVGAVTLYAMLAAVLGVAVGALIRFAAGAVAVLLMWPLVVEPILGNMPNVGSEIGIYLPFANMFEFLGVAWLFPSYDVPWGHVGAVCYFTAVVAIVFVAAVVVVDRRDA